MSGNEYAPVEPDQAPKYDSDGSTHTPRSDNSMEEETDLAEVAERVLETVLNGAELSLTCIEVSNGEHWQVLMEDQVNGRDDITLDPSQPSNTSFRAWKTRYMTDHGISLVTAHFWPRKTYVFVRSV